MSGDLAVRSHSDETLVRAVLAGDVEAYGKLVERYQNSYARFAVRMLGSHADADEALQSAFVRAFRALRQCQDPQRFGVWLYRIVVNECRTLAARRGRRERRLVRLDGGDDLTAIFPSPIEDRDRDTREEIEYALAQLPVDQREAFILKYVEDRNYEEIAEITGAGISALKMRVKRACERLRELLEEVYYG